jgi:hypothetical protein
MPGPYSDEARRLRHRILLLETELHELQRQQQALISALDRARAELSGAVIYDGEALISSLNG